MLLESKYEEYSSECEYIAVNEDCLFYGCCINNLYDEKRISLREIQGILPKRVIYKNKNINTKPLYFYGYTFTPKGEDRLLINKLKNFNNIDYTTFCNIIEKLGYSPGENYIKLKYNIYPLDNVHIERYITEKDSKTVRIYNEELPLFQQITSLNTFVFTA
jgi:hypothetical protein